MALKQHMLAQAFSRFIVQQKLKPARIAYCSFVWYRLGKEEIL
jgi:hypothetical protein